MSQQFIASWTGVTEPIVSAFGLLVIATSVPHALIPISEAISDSLRRVNKFPHDRKAYTETFC